MTATRNAASITVGSVKRVPVEGVADAARPGRVLLPAVAGRAPTCWRPTARRSSRPRSRPATPPRSRSTSSATGAGRRSGNNADQAKLDAQIAASGARFAVTVGDNGYNGSQLNYGDLQQTGDGTSAIFGPSFWTVAGSSIPLFTAVGNHGLSGTSHTDITTWTEDQAVSTSGGRYQNARLLLRERAAPSTTAASGTPSTPARPASTSSTPPGATRTAAPPRPTARTTPLTSRQARRNTSGCSTTCRPIRAR